MQALLLPPLANQASDLLNDLMDDKVDRLRKGLSLRLFPGLL